MKSSQSMWCLCSTRFDLRTTQRKSSERTTVMDLFFKVWGVCQGGVEAEKSALYVSKSKDLPPYKLWQVGKYRYIQYQRSLRCYPTMFSLKGAGGFCISVLKCFILLGGDCTICRPSCPFVNEGFISFSMIVIDSNDCLEGTLMPDQSWGQCPFSTFLNFYYIVIEKVTHSCLSCWRRWKGTNIHFPSGRKSEAGVEVLCGPTLHLLLQARLVHACMLTGKVKTVLQVIPVATMAEASLHLRTSKKKRLVDWDIAHCTQSFGTNAAISSKHFIKEDTKLTPAQRSHVLLSIIVDYHRFD